MRPGASLRRDTYSCLVTKQWRTVEETALGFRSVCGECCDCCVKCYGWSDRRFPAGLGDTIFGEKLAVSVMPQPCFAFAHREM